MTKTRPIHRITVVIPTFNESETICEHLEILMSNASRPLHEVIVVDSQRTTDGTACRAQRAGVKVERPDCSGRSRQMHHGASIATGDVILFLHADTRPPVHFDRYIRESLDKGNDFGMFSYRFDSESKLLKINSSTTKSKGMFTGGGDQGMFIRKSTYLEYGGFDRSLCIMEDFDLYWRLKKRHVPFEIIPKDMVVSARKYHKNSYLRVQLVNLAAVLGFKAGVPAARLRKMYGSMLR